MEGKHGQIQGKWYRERKPKKNPKPEAKKNKNYSTPIVPWKSAEHLEIAPSMPASMAHSGT